MKTVWCRKSPPIVGARTEMVRDRQPGVVAKLGRLAGMAVVYVRFNHGMQLAFARSDVWCERIFDDEGKEVMERPPVPPAPNPFANMEIRWRQPQQAAPRPQQWAYARALRVLQEDEDPEQAG